MKAPKTTVVKFDATNSVKTPEPKILRFRMRASGAIEISKGTRAALGFTGSTGITFLCTPDIGDFNKQVGINLYITTEGKDGLIPHVNKKTDALIFHSRPLTDYIYDNTPRYSKEKSLLYRVIPEQQELDGMKVWPVVLVGTPNKK